MNFWSDRSTVFSMSSPLRELMASRGLVLNNNEDVISFCGIVECHGELNIFFPRQCSENVSVKDACSLMTALKKYSREKVHIATEDEQEGETGLSSLSVKAEILEDYRDYGLYSRRVIRKSINDGRADWKRTIQNVHPAEGKNGSPIYPVIHTKKKSSSISSEVTRIHASIVKDCDRQLGWWITGKENGRVALELEGAPQVNISNVQKINLLRNELRYVYSEREINLLSLLIRLLEQQFFVGGGYVAGVREFQFIWEYMLNSVLDGVNITSMLPKPNYISFDDNKDNIARKGMTPDIILQEGNYSFVVVADAKYYTASTLENSPGWPDLVKQFFYAKGLKMIFPEAAISNYFIFPGRKTHFSSARLSSSLIDQQALDVEFPPVLCTYIAPELVFTSFSKRKKLNIFRESFFEKFTAS